MGREIRSRKRDGSIITNLYSGQVFQLGTKRYVLSQVVDLTQHKHADEEQRLHLAKRDRSNHGYQCTLRMNGQG